MIVRNFTANVVCNVRLGDTVRGPRADPSANRTEFSKKVPVEGRKRSTREGKFGRPVVRKDRVGVLEERDEYQPVVYPETTVNCL
jgi:hypothetical protein